MEHISTLHIHLNPILAQYNFFQAILGACGALFA
jgi:hypothetical protein